jgi:2Fe-2S iron-sulfur cluster binding domain
VTTMSLSIDGKPYGPFEVRDELSMNDFLREYLGLTGTKFGCGVAQCLSCAVIVDNPDGTSQTSPTCIVPAVSFAGESIRTIEGHAERTTVGAAEGFRRTFLVPVRLLHGRFFERGPGAVGTPGEIAGVARRARSDYPGCSRRPSLPLHGLHQIS